MTKTEMERGFQEIWKLFAETDKKVEKKEASPFSSNTDFQYEKDFSKQEKGPDKTMDLKFSFWGDATASKSSRMDW